MSDNEDKRFDDIKQRLDEIVDLVSEDGIDLDEALSLYEEAVKLGMAACDASELGIEEDRVEQDAEEGHADGNQETEAVDVAEDVEVVESDGSVETIEEVGVPVDVGTDEQVGNDL